MKKLGAAKYGKSFGERIAWLMDSFKDNNSTMAKKAGLSEGTIRNYATGAIPSLENAIKIADAYDISFEWLCKGLGEPQPKIIIEDGLPLTIDLAHAEKAGYDLQLFQQKYKITFTPEDMQNLMRFMCIQYQEGHDVSDMSLRHIHQLIKKPVSDS